MWGLNGPEPNAVQINNSRQTDKRVVPFGYRKVCPVPKPRLRLMIAHRPRPFEGASFLAQTPNPLTEGCRTRLFVAARSYLFLRDPRVDEIALGPASLHPGPHAEGRPKRPEHHASWKST